MKRRAPTPLKTILLLCALAPMTLARCGGSASDASDDVLLGTETGNPPVIKKEALHLEVAPGGVRLIGTPGAITPGADVQVTNRRTGETVATSAAADGSVDLTLGGQTNDVYEVTVRRGGQSTTITLTGSDLPSDLSTLSCEALGNALGPVIAATYAEADHSCSVDEDCAERYWGEACYNRCGSEVLASSAVEATSALAEQRIAGLCSEIDARGCRNDAPPCVGASERVLRCEQGQCVGRALEELSCQDLRNYASLRRLEEMRSADRSCTSDDECTVARNGVSCFADCGVAEPISIYAVASVDGAVQYIEQTFCAQVDNADCPPQPVPPCAPGGPEPTVACVQGQCTLRYVEE